ncbi:uncharacterized protein LOC117644928 [Thrips palmi]|uniref:Uncharacterized protein LOC117644928 n=1 Tax=Thrips palmi TaxID=161013 RepID=A0A6P8YTX1_THRPL|nr:uncharacterized protein LOC117644928 [Thrips palmi]
MSARGARGARRQSGKAASKPSTEVTSRMASLPDDLLLRVFGFLDDAASLLDRVPLVCQRWRRLSRDPRAWASVCVDAPRYRRDPWGEDSGSTDDSYEDDSDGSSGSDASSDSNPATRMQAAFKEAARAILLAPALRRVKFNWSQEDAHCERGLAMLTSALRRTRAAVREVAFPDAEHDNVGGLHSGLSTTAADVVDELLQFLRADKEHLRVLHLERVLNASSLFDEEDDWWGVDDGDDEDDDPEDDDEALSVKVADTLAELQQLEELSLYVDAKPKYQPGFLGHAGLPRLRRLKVMPHYAGYNPDNVDGMVDLVSALLGGAAQTLRVVDLSHDFYPLRPRAKAQLGRCRQLRGLACNLADVGVVRGMPHLRELELLVNDDDTHYLHSHNLANWLDPAPELPALLRANVDLLQGCSLESLRDLRVRVVWSPAFPKEVFGPHKALFVELFGALAAAARHATALHLDVGDLGKLLPEAFARTLQAMRGLRVADLGSFRADLVPHLVGLEQLREVSGYIYSREDKQKRVDAKSIRDFKAKRPDVVCRIKA